MSQDQVFIHEDYRDIVRSLIDANHGIRGYQKKLSEAAGCHPSYLTKALKYECELTPDHALGMAKCFQFGDLQRDYFLESVNYARAATPLLKKHCKRRMEALRRESQDIGKRFSLPVKASYHSEYYANWTMAAIHILSSVPGHQTPAAIAARLGLDIKLVESSLKKLLAMDLVAKEGQRYVAIRESLHIERGSVYSFLHLSNWRLKALNDAQSDNAGVHFTSILSLSRADLLKLKELLLQFVGTCQKTVASSAEETVVALNVDYFEL